MHLRFSHSSSLLHSAAAWFTFAAVFALGAVAIDAAEINTSTLGQNSWYSDDTRSDGLDGFTAGDDLVGITNTDLSTGVPPTVGIAGHDAAIDQHISFVATPPSAPPALEHQAAVNLSIGSSGSGKSTISHIIDGTVGTGGGGPSGGHGAASSIFAPGLLIDYSWMGDGSVGPTASLKIGIKTPEFAGLLPQPTSSRTGENVWDKLLIYEPGNGNGGTSDGTWQSEAISYTSGSWWMVDRVRGFSGIAIGNPLPLSDIAGATGAGITYSGGDSLQDIFNIIIDPDSVVTNIQFGIGSGNADANVYVNQLETSFYRAGDITTFGAAPELPSIPEPSSLLLAGLGAALLGCCRRRRKR